MLVPPNPSWLWLEEHEGEDILWYHQWVFFGLTIPCLAHVVIERVLLEICWFAMGGTYGCGSG
jgi:hypothetical protein